jgi:alkylmercury lyase
MRGTDSNLDDLAPACANAFPPFDEREQRIVVATYRALSEGRPVSAEQIAEATRLRPDEVRDALAGWHSLAHLDADGRVVAFIGLCLSPTAHRFDVNGRTLHTWCAWDTLFLPRVLGQIARVQSECPVTGRPIRLLSAPDGVHDLEPAGALVSFVTPERAEAEKDLIATFCCHVHFLSSPDAAERWLARHPETLILSVEEAWQLGQMCLDARLPIERDPREV